MPDLVPTGSKRVVEKVITQEEDILFVAADELANRNINPQEIVDVEPFLAHCRQWAVQRLSVATALTGGRDAKNVHRVDLDPDTDSEASSSKTDDEQDEQMSEGGDDTARGSHAEGSSSTQAGSAAQSQDV